MSSTLSFRAPENRKCAKEDGRLGRFKLKHHRHEVGGLFTHLYRATLNRVPDPEILLKPSLIDRCVKLCKGSLLL